MCGYSEVAPALFCRTLWPLDREKSSGTEEGSETREREKNNREKQSKTEKKSARQKQW